MGKIADDMARLADEIYQAREDRVRLTQELTADAARRSGEVDVMLKNFHEKHEGMARQERARRGNFVAQLSHEVAATLGDFRTQHAEMAQTSQAQRRRSVRKVQAEVSVLLNDTAADMAAARAHWRRQPAPANTARRVRPATATNEDNALSELMRDFGAGLSSTTATRRRRKA
jgi:hypothetical protein